MKADLAAGLRTAAIDKKHCWNTVSVRVCHNAFHKNVDFLVVFFRVLLEIVRFSFLLRGTHRFCCVKWSLKALLRSGSKIAFNSVSMPTEAISRHHFLQMLHSFMVRVNKNTNHFQQQTHRQADRQHSHETSNPTEIVI